MASATVDPATTAGDRLSIDAIPIIDLRLLSQSDLTALSRSSSLSSLHQNDVVIPTINRSLFNESAGSRKQTFSRLRLSRHPTATPNHHGNRLSPTAPPERAENARIIALFKDLFNCNSNDDDKKNDDKYAVVVYEDAEEKEREIVNKNGVAVDLGELGKVEHPYTEEIRRRTEGMEGAEELLGFLTGLEGEWGSRRKKRKIVDASELGDALPKGWKILIGIKKKQGRAWLYCRRYISPNGRHFLTCKEVASYLISLCGLQVANFPNSSDCHDPSPADNKLASVNDADDHMELLALPSSEIHDHRDHLVSSISNDHEKQLALVSKVDNGEAQVVSALRCHKCSTPFNEKNDLLHHLVSCHKRKRRKAGAPIEDDVTMKDGQYECQFCQKMFHERSSYFGHVGNHVKHYVKSIGGLARVSPKQNSNSPSFTNGTSSATLQMSQSLEVDVDPNARIPTAVASSDLNLSSLDDEPRTGTGAEINLDSCNRGQDSMPLNVEENMSITRQDENSVEEPGKMEGPSEAINKEIKKIHNTADRVTNLVFSSGAGVVDQNVIQDVACAVGMSSNAPEKDAELERSLCSTHSVENTSDGRETENGVLASNKEELPSTGISEDMGLGSSVGERRGDEEMKHDSGELTSEPPVGHNAPETDATSDLQPERSIERFAVSFEDGKLGGAEEKTGVVDSKSIHLELNNRWSEIGSLTPECGQRTVSSSIIHEPGMDQFYLGKSELTFDTDSQGVQERNPESIMFDASWNKANTYDDNNGATGALLDSRAKENFQIEQSSEIKDSMSEVPAGISEKLRCDDVVNSGSSVFFPSVGADACIRADSVATNQQEKISASSLHITLGNVNSLTDESNIFEGCDNIVEDSKHEQVPKHVSSGHTGNEYMHGITGSNVSGVSAVTAMMQHPPLDKVESSRTDKFMLDFGSSMTQINSGFVNPVQHERTPVASSPFLFWKDPSCGAELNQNKLYVSTGQEVRQGRISHSNSLSPSCGAELNQNKLYVGTGQEVRQGRISHNNSLSLAGASLASGVGYNLNKACINNQTYGLDHNQTGVCDTTRENTGQERISFGNSLSLAGVQQTYEMGYNTNSTYMGAVQDLSGLGELGRSRDTDLIIGFGNSNSASNEGVSNEFIWRTNEGNMPPNSFMDSSSSQVQSSGSFRAFDIFPDKDGSELYSFNDSIVNFEGLRSTSVAPMEFSFLSTQDSSSQLEAPKVLPYNSNMDQSFDSSVWLDKGTSLSNMASGRMVSLTCVWCGTEFHQDSIGSDAQAGSIGYLCPTCKARISGQFL